MYSDSARNQAGRGWVAKAISFSLASAFAGVTAGALLGAIGGLIPLERRAAIATLLALAAVVVGSLQLGGRLVMIPQCDRETPQRWLHRGPLRWAISNGWALGLGATSRIGFWLWYVIPAAALLAGQPALGAMIYGTYGVVRGVAVWGIILGPARRHGADEFGLRLLQLMGVARGITAATLMGIGIAVVIALGF